MAQGMNKVLIQIELVTVESEDCIWDFVDIKARLCMGRRGDITASPGTRTSHIIIINFASRLSLLPERFGGCINDFATCTLQGGVTRKISRPQRFLTPAVYVGSGSW